MVICKKCKAPEENGVCPLCGRSRTLRAAKDEDMVYLTSCEYIWSKLVEDTLSAEGIDCYRHGSLGSGIIVSIGELAELYRYYVACRDYDRARAVLPDFSDTEMTEEELIAYMDKESQNEGEAR